MIDLLSLPETAEATAAPPPGTSITPSPADARELLARFATTGHQDAFQEVMRRYGGMVFNLCFEITGNRQDAEDAVQAAFLSLAVQARSGQPVQAIGPWLQQVARRMSLDINRARRRRKKREEKHGEDWEQRMTEARADGNGGSGGHGNPASAAGWEELRAVVQQELNQLPPKYRMPVILHYYGSLSREEIARELNCKVNTLGVRLHRGREMLAKRLAARGVTLSGVVLGVLMAEVVHSIVTDRMVQDTTQAAVLLSAGHPYACGVISPEIIALAQTATRALASAKIRFACSLAIFASGAAAAGAQAVSHVTSWDFPASVRENVGRLFDNLWHPSPRADKNPTPSQPDDLAHNDATPTDGHAPSELASPRPSPRQAPVPLPDPGNWGGLNRVPPQQAVPQFAGPRRTGDPAVPFSPRNPQGPGGNRAPFDEPPIVRSGPSNRSFNAPGLNGGGGRGGRDNDNGSDNIKDADPRKPSEIANDPPTIDPQVPPPPRPNRGGVKLPHDNPAGGGVLPKPQGGVAGQNPQLPDPIVIPHTPPPVPIPPQIFWPIPPVDSQGPEPLPPIDYSSPPPDYGGTKSGDTLHVSTDYVADAPAESFDAVAARPVGPSRFQLDPGQSLIGNQVVVGYQGTGVAIQAGGFHQVDSLYLGVIKTGHGLYQLTGGELRITASPAGPDVPVHSIEVGSAGEGVFQLGNATDAGRITQTAGGGVDLTVGAIRSARGTFRGWGQVALTGRLTNNGQIVADGYGQDRTLDLSTFATVTHGFYNRADKGWYAVNRGRLDLPAIPVAAGTNAYTWGGSNEDDLSLVNSARVTFHEATGEGVVKMSLLALDRSDVPAFPAGHHLVGVWAYDQGGLTAGGGTDLLVRYDDALAASLGLDENVLKLWTFDGEWHRHDFDESFVRDPANHTLFVHTATEGVSAIAVSAPEPGTIGLIAGGIALLGLRRQRRR